MKGAAMSFSAVICGVVVLLMAADVCGQGDWGVTYSPSSLSICALKGSTVEMSCNYRYPTKYKGTNIKIKETFWFTKEFVALKDDTNYSRRVKYNCTNTSCTLKIFNVSQTDSQNYKFRFITNHQEGKFTGSPGVSLSVTDLQVKVNRLNNPIRIQLTCHTDCQLDPPVSYVWLEDEKEHEEKNNNLVLSSFNTIHRYQCAIRGHEDVPSPAVYAPQSTVLSVTPSETVEGSTVTLTCSCDAKPEAKYNIYMMNEDQHGQLVSTEIQLVFSSIQVSDSGKYYCTAGNDLGSRTSPSIDINVKYGPKNCYVSVKPSGPVEEGKSVTLTCSSDANPAASYTWYKDNKTIRNGSKDFNILSIGSQHRGSYSCKAQNLYGECNSSPLFLDVLYAPNVSVSITPSGEIMEGNQVTLTCSSDANPAAKYNIYKMNEDQHGQLVSTETQLVFSSILVSDSGKYYCTAGNDLGIRTSPSIDINVKYGPKNCSVSAKPSGSVEEGKSVTLTCSSDANPAASYTWYKDNKIIPNESKDFHVFVVGSQHRGSYSCKAQNLYGKCNSSHLFLYVLYAPNVSVSITPSDAPRTPSVSQSPSGHIVVGSSVTLTCSSDANPAASYTWYKEGEETPKASRERFTINNIQNEHSGKYYCTAQNKIGRQNTSLSVTVVAGQSKLVVIVTVASILLIMIFLLIFLISRKWRTSTPPPKPGGNPNNIEQLQQSQRSLSKSQGRPSVLQRPVPEEARDPVYENFQPGKTATAHLEEEGENIEYATVKFGQRTENPEPEDDSNALYSVVNKPKPGN